MNGDEEGDPDEGGGNRVISWGCGEFGQHCHGCKEDVAFSIGLLKENLSGQVKFVACGASHTILVNGKYQSWELSLLCQKGERERDREYLTLLSFSKTYFCIIYIYKLDDRHFKILFKL